MKKQTGFTIVELLVVIVVIGILAAITIVAFNGVQGRALNNKTETAVAAYQKALIAYAMDNGTYPDGSSRKSVCLGDAAALPDGCYGGVVDQNFLDKLKPYLGNTFPAPSKECLRMYTGCRIGAAYWVNSYAIDSTPETAGPTHSWWLIYVLANGARCTASNISGGGWTTPRTEPNANTWIEQSHNTSLCRVKLPNPASL